MFQNEGFNEIQGKMFLSLDKFFLPISTEIINGILYIQVLSTLFQLPLTFNPMAQISSDGSWHIPYEMEFDPSPPQSFEAPSTWLCLRSS
jgi:hypothetical protein